MACALLERVQALAHRASLPAGNPCWCA